MATNEHEVRLPIPNTPGHEAVFTLENGAWVLRMPNSSDPDNVFASIAAEKGWRGGYVNVTVCLDEPGNYGAYNSYDLDGGRIRGADHT